MEETERFLFGLGCEIEESQRLGLGVGKIMFPEKRRRCRNNRPASEEHYVSEEHHCTFGEDEVLWFKCNCPT